jgi:hypothetical protein
MTGLDPAAWSWARLAAVSAAWALLLTIAGWWAVARAIAHAKQTDAAGGDFVVALPYGTRHLSILVVLVLLPPLLALARKLAAG